MTDLVYTVEGRPKTWARKRLDARGRKPKTFTADDQKAAMQAHGWRARAALNAARGTWSVDGAFAIGVRGYWPDAAVGDVDRLLSLAMDALEGIAYRADRQVRSVLHADVIADGSPERVEVTVRRLETDPVQPRRKPRPGAVKCARCNGTGGWAPRPNAALADCDDCDGTGTAKESA